MYQAKKCNVQQRFLEQNCTGQLVSGTELKQITLTEQVNKTNNQTKLQSQDRLHLGGTLDLSTLRLVLLRAGAEFEAL